MLSWRKAMSPPAITPTNRLSISSRCFRAKAISAFMGGSRGSALQPFSAWIVPWRAPPHALAVQAHIRAKWRCRSADRDMRRLLGHLCRPVDEQSRFLCVEDYVVQHSLVLGQSPSGRPRTPAAHAGGSDDRGTDALTRAGLAPEVRPPGRENLLCMATRFSRVRGRRPLLGPIRLRNT